MGGSAPRPSPDEASPATPAARTSTVVHRVPFYETDGMGIVHHANYVRYFELARVVWMDEHDRAYREYVAEGLHFATTHVEAHYLRPARFDDRLEITTWLEWVHGASLRMGYEILRGSERLATGATEHAMVDDQGRPRRIPRQRRQALAQAVGQAPRPTAAARAARRSRAKPKN